MQLKTVNLTHYVFSAGPADSDAPLTDIAYVPGSIVSWGFTGTIVGVYATSNGENGTAEAYVSEWRYEGGGQVVENLL